MNHHYPNSYHGYVRGAPGGIQQNMGYGHGVYDEQMTMGPMSQSRNSYQMPQYQDSGQMHPSMMQHQQANSMYPPGGYMNQMSGSSYGVTGGYSPHYGMANQSNMTSSSSPMMIGPRGGSAMAGYYNNAMDSQAVPRAPPTAAPNPSYPHNASGSSMHCQNQMNHLSANQNCSPSQTTTMPGGPAQAPHCASPHGVTAASHGTTATHSNNSNSFQGQGTQGNPAMMPGAQGQQRPIMGSRSGSSGHSIPQHPMRHPNTQQNPQEIADNILQIASSYPTNQTVQVPLKSRHAPYHIPRSPHYSMSSSEHGHSSPLATSSQQASPAPQPSPTPSTSSVKSPTPSLAPIPNPIPSPGITGLRSPCNQGASACGPQCSPAHLVSNYSGHSQPSPSPHHFSPTSMGNQQNYSPYASSPTASRNTHIPYSSAQNPNVYSNPDSQDRNATYSSPLQTSASPLSQNHLIPSETSSNPQFTQQGRGGNNPLMSLQKLVMLPETQVVDPKSVVNDACLSSQSNPENEEIPKNVEDPAEGCAESSDSSVGCPGQFSSYDSQPLQAAPIVASEQFGSESNFSLSTENTSADAPGDVRNTLAGDESGQSKVVDSFIAPPETDTAMDDEMTMSNSQEVNGMNQTHTAETMSSSVGGKNNGDDITDKTTNSFVGEIVKEANLSSVENGENLVSVDWKEANMFSVENEGNLSSAKLEEANIASVENGDDLSLIEFKETDLSVGEKASKEETGNANLSVEESTHVPAGGDEIQTNCAPLMDIFSSGNTEAIEKSKEVTESSKIESLNHSDINSEVQKEKVLSGVDAKPTMEQNESILHSLKRKNGKVNGLHEDVKPSLRCRSPGILSEVPLLVNGMATDHPVNDNIEKDDDNEVDRRLQNGFSPRLRSRLRIGEKASQFVRLTTPCSIAVGADERAVCERFVFRRNEYRQSLRTTRLLCNGRIRQDSTGNGDSDESIENVSDGSFHAMGNPQDGCKKKSSSTSSKKNDVKNSTVNNTRVSKKDGLVSHREGQVRNSSNGHISYSNAHNPDGSGDEDGVCYYEGVDSSDFYLNTVSSDDSIPSSQEGKQASPKTSTSTDKNHLLLSDSLINEKSQEEQTEPTHDQTISSPPSKRTRRSPGQLLTEPVNRKYSPSRGTSNSSTNELGTEGETSSKSATVKSNLKNQNSSPVDCHGNGKIIRVCVRRKNLNPTGEEITSPSEQPKLQEVVVRLEKSPIVEKLPVKLGQVENSARFVKIEKEDPIVIDDSSPEKCDDKSSVKSYSVQEFVTADTSACKKEAVSVQEDAMSKDSTVKVENSYHSGNIDSATVSGQSKTPANNRTSPAKKKKVSKKNKKKNCSFGNRDRANEVKDSFKSMKFSRTLDMMKSQRKKDSSHTGPFLRIEGSRNTPNTVSIYNQYNQSSQDMLAVAGKHKHKHNHRKSSSRNIVSATVHMVSSLSNDKTVMVSSVKPIPNQQWSCAFCSHHSSFRSMGDLFGPYFKETDLPVVESIALEESKKGDSKDSPKSSVASTSKQSKVASVPSEKKGSKKRKLTDKPEQALPQEIWLHESCALWAPGVFLIGNKIYGLDDAIRETAETTCSACKGKGAMMGCLYKGCAMKYHFACAMERGCHLDEGNFSLLCPKHKDKKINSASSTSSSSLPLPSASQLKS